ncbi:putative capsule biosynthesis phosphatase [Escherichia coli]|nr:putative capsule biosynthesis phosphatase [Escherichia coli]
MKNIIIDLDGTLTIDADTSYENKPVNIDVVQKLREYKSLGFNITILTSRKHANL